MEKYFQNSLFYSYSYRFFHQKAKGEKNGKKCSSLNFYIFSPLTIYFLFPPPPLSRVKFENIHPCICLNVYFTSNTVCYLLVLRIYLSKFDLVEHSSSIKPLICRKINFVYHNWVWVYINISSIVLSLKIPLDISVFDWIRFSILM